MEAITVESIPIMVGREEDGPWWADIESSPVWWSWPSPADRQEDQTWVPGQMTARSSCASGWRSVTAGRSCLMLKS